MPRTLIPMHELQALLLAQIRSHEGCEGVRDISVYHVTDERADNNWSVGTIICGSAPSNLANRAAIYAQASLRHKYDLLTD
jgi:hypothetical protein